MIKLGPVTVSVTVGATRLLVGLVDLYRGKTYDDFTLCDSFLSTLDLFEVDDGKTSILVDSTLLHRHEDSIDWTEFLDHLGC